ncbi:uncharacterized protein (DUF849 family) [Actinokineospora baliensis]|uniref:3-keto-5-aminohexanoate cleavage protein n=1 Tax=Actinokineospora baliensis TaxID=547056 RepID=UPI0027DD61AC|nr:3-keto-5-aminohexanoate cleavage protein [Actinokineospora baliensis]MBM7772738.1 uncharacterized protein (DUF849 family) [Actinokineospora baliensis]
MDLQACLNGERSAADAPVTAVALAAAAAEVAALGVASVHVHPRDATGATTLIGPELAPTVAAIRAAAPGTAVGVTTGAWAQPDPARRVAAIAAWVGLSTGRPDFASVNVHEDGWQEVCAALTAAGIAVELGVFDVPAAELLREHGIPAGAVRVLAEVQPHAEAAPLLDALAWSPLPILLHGEEDTAWPVLTEALRRGLPTRMGLEDTLHLPDGTRATTNADLIHAVLR